MQRYQQLDVFKIARQVALEVYELTQVFPSVERYALAQQMRRSAVSVGSNIAEGAGRSSRKEFRHFLSLARGSASELHFQVSLAMELGYLAEERGLEVLG